MELKWSPKEAPMELKRGSSPNGAQRTSFWVPFGIENGFENLRNFGTSNESPPRPNKITSWFSETLKITKFLSKTGHAVNVALFASSDPSDRKIFKKRSKMMPKRDPK